MPRRTFLQAATAAAAAVATRSLWAGDDDPNRPPNPSHLIETGTMNRPPALTEVHRGVTFGFYARNGVLGSPWAREQVDNMLALNVNWVVLTPIVMQETAHTTRQYRDFEITPNDHELYEIIGYMRGKGMRVQLRPMLETQDGCGRLQVWFQPDRERIPGRVSRHWADWFQSMTLRSQHYARIARETGCELYGLDSELDRTVDQSDHWKRVIEAVRKIYEGPVTSCHTTHMGLIDYEKVLSNRNHWFHDLDMLHLSCYAPGANKPGASVEEMVNNLKPNLEYFRGLASIYGKPIAFGETGCTSSFGGAMSPSGWRGDGGYEPSEQANYLEAIFRTYWNEPWWRGLYWWKWDEQLDRPQYRDDPRGDKGFTIWGKPAGEVMKAWFGRTDR